MNNEISPSHIHVASPIKDKDGNTLAGFYGIYAKEGQEEPNYLQREILIGYASAGYVTFFGSVKDVVDILNQYIR